MGEPVKAGVVVANDREDSQAEVEQATQVAVSAGAQATLAATQARGTEAGAASVAGLAAAVASGAGGFIVGIFLGLAIPKAK